MPRYKYKALTLDNKKVSASVEARDENDFRLAMRKMELVPVKFREIDDDKRSYKLQINEVAEFCRQLTNMFSSGITAVRAIQIIKDKDFKQPKLKEVYEKLHNELIKGTTISDSMRMQGRAFPELLINMFASGEASGQLEKVTMNMALHYEKEHKLNGKIKAATRYPKIVSVILVLVVIGIFVFILPMFFDVLFGMGAELPLITRIIVGITDFMLAYWLYLLIGILILVVLVSYLLQVPKIRLNFDKLKLRLPAIGKPLRTVYTARFARTLASLYSSGVPMIRALEIAATVLNNKYIESQFPNIIKDVRNGELLSASVAKIDGFDMKLSGIIVVGEESGRLDVMLESTAEMFDYEAEQALGAIVALTEPVMLVIMAAVILVVILGVMLPVMTMHQAIQG